MSTYICKCGRTVQKAITANNTGNRQTEGCTGCPYLLPWGPMKYTEGKGFKMDVQGYECRMSKNINYTTRFSGSVTDKCTCYIASLDFEFLERVSSWIAETYPNREIFGPFFQDTIRAGEYSSNGRYRMCITCTQNKAGMAAKAALLAQFFNPDGSRKDLDPEAERQLILDRITAGKAAAQEKETPCAEVNPSPTTNPTPTAAPSSTQSPATAPTASTAETAPGGQSKLYLNSQKSAAYRCSPEGTLQFYYFSGRPEWVHSDHLDYQYEKKNPDKLAPAQWLDWWASVRIGWTEITQKEFDDMCKESKTTAAPMPAAAATTAAPAAAPAETSTTSESAADASRCRASISGAAAAENSSGQPSPAEAAPATQSPSDAAAVCSEADGRHPQIVERQPPLIQPETIYVSPNGIRYKIAVVAVDKQQCFHTERFVNGKWSAANSSVYKNLRDANGEFEAWIRTEKLKPEVAAAAIVPTSNDAPEIVDDGSEPGTPAFDYSGLDKQTVADLHLAEREYTSGKRLAEAGLRRMAEAIAIAHEALCGGVVANCDNSKHGNRGEDTFRRFCSNVLGVSKDTAYRLLQVSGLFERSSPKEQKVLAELAPSLLYAAAKPSAPKELVQAVKSGDITTHKQYQELLKQYQDTLAENQQLREGNAITQQTARRADEARKAAEAERDQARREKGELAADCNRLGRQEEKALSDKREAEQAAAEAEKQRDAAQQTAQDAQARIRELESRPLEVVGASPEDIAKWRAEGAAAAKKELQTELRQAQKEAAEQRRRAEIAEEDSEQSAQEAQDYAAQLGQARQQLEQGEAVRMVRQATDACEALLRPQLYALDGLGRDDYKAAMALLEELRDKLIWATMNDAWPGDDWPDGYYYDDGSDEPDGPDEWEDEEE